MEMVHKVQKKAQKVYKK